MAFFDELKGKATDLVQSGVAKSMQLAEIAKLKTANMGEEDTIKKAYIELGKLYYAEFGAVPGAAYAAACERITAAKAAIETNNDRIAQLKTAAGESADAEVEIEVEVKSEESNVTEFPAQPAPEADPQPEEPEKPQE